jgi:hypothetical protein
MLGDRERRTREAVQRRFVAGESPPRSRLHPSYVALEGNEVVLLSVVGVVLVAGIAS